MPDRTFHKDVLLEDPHASKPRPVQHMSLAILVLGSRYSASRNTYQKVSFGHYQYAPAESHPTKCGTMRSNANPDRLLDSADHHVTPCQAYTAEGLQKITYKLQLIDDVEHDSENCRCQE